MTYLTHIATLLEEISDLFPDDVAIVQGSTRVGWRDLEQRAARLANWLAETGVGPGDRVAIGLRNQPAYLVAMFAALKLRATPVNVNFRYRAQEFAYVLADSGSVVAVIDEALSREVEDARQQVEGPFVVVYAGEDEAPTGSVYLSEALASPPHPRMGREDDEWLLYTGGTTGYPKAVVRPQSSLLISVVSQALHYLGESEAPDFETFQAALRQSRPRQIVLLPASPLMHGTGLYGALTALVAGGTVVLLSGQRFDPEEMVEVMASSGVTDLHIVGDVFARPLADTLDERRAAGRLPDLASLQRIQSVGTVWTAETKRRLLEHVDVTLTDLVAATEGGPYAMSVSDRSTPDDQLDVFRLAPGARLVDERGRDVVQAGIGRLAAPAPAGARYAGDPEKTASTFREIDGGLYSIPGDIARLGPDGSLRFLGRGSGVINSGGEKVYPAEVEDVLRQHPAVSDAVVLGVAEPRWGEVVAAVVERSPGHHIECADALSRHVAKTLAPYKRPRKITFVDELERTPTGKVDARWASQVLASLRHGDRKEIDG